MADPKKYDLDFRPDYFGSTAADQKTDGSGGGGTGATRNGEAETYSAVRSRSLYGDYFLPHQEETEVEIARIELESWTCDIISVRAQSRGGKIFYSIVDEYEDLYSWSCKPEMSDQPLTMAELIVLMKTTDSTLCHPGIVFGCLEFKHENDEEAEDLRYFASVSSEYYPELHDWYEDAMEEWCEARWRSDKPNAGVVMEIFVAFPEQRELDPDSGGGYCQKEQLKVVRKGRCLWCLEQDPAFTNMAAYGDTIEGNFDENEVLIVKRVIDRSEV